MEPGNEKSTSLIKKIFVWIWITALVAISMVFVALYARHNPLWIIVGAGIGYVAVAMILAHAALSFVRIFRKRFRIRFNWQFLGLTTIALLLLMAHYYFFRR